MNNYLMHNKCTLEILSEFQIVASVSQVIQNITPRKMYKTSTDLVSQIELVGVNNTLNQRS
jgi:hypothetical protein